MFWYIVCYDVVVVLWLGVEFVFDDEGFGFFGWFGVIWDWVILLCYGENLY